MHLLLLALPPAFVAALKPYAWYLALGALSLIASRRSQIDAWAESKPRLAGLMKLLRATGLDPWLALQGLTLIVKGRLPAAVTAGSKSIKPPPLAALALSVLLLTSSCAAAKPIIKSVNDVAVDACVATFGAQKRGLSLDDIVRTFCKTDEQLQPFVDSILSAHKLAAAKQP